MSKKTAAKSKPKNLKEKFKKEILFVCSCCAVITLLALSSLNLEFYQNRKKVLAVSRDLTAELVFWEDIVNQNPTYRDGWIELSKVYQDLGELEKSQAALVKAKKIDPNYSAF